MTLKPRVVPSVRIPGGTGGLPPGSRADVVLAGLEQVGPSFELRVFVNNPRANAGTEMLEDDGYAGSVYIYGYGRPPDDRPHIPMARYVPATGAIQAASVAGSSVTVTLVPVAFSGPEPAVDLSKVAVALRLL